MKTPRCANCRIGSIIEKTAHKTGRIFWACDNYPRCKVAMSEKDYEEFLRTGVIPEKNRSVEIKSFTPKPLPRGTAWPMLMKGTSEQEHIWDVFTDGNNVVVDALAGTGKSWSIVQACRRASDDNYIIVVAYNKRNAQSILPKLPPNATASTIHSIGARAVWNAFGYIKPTNYKSRNMLEKRYNLEKIEDQDELLELSMDIRAASKIIDLCKANVVRHPSQADIDHIIDNSENIDPVQYGRVVDMVQYVMSINHNQETIREFGIDFGDMIYLPVILDLSVEKCDAVFVDEAQDLYLATHLLVLMMTDQVIAVGDTNQAIYAFTGALTNSMEKLAERIGKVIRMPLSVNWRCGTAHLELARLIVPDIQPHPNAPRGNIYEITVEQFEKAVKPGHMVMCRTNAPMIKYVYKLLRSGKGATIVGREFGEQLENLVERIAKIKGAKKGSYVSMPEFIRALDNYLAKELEKLAQKKDADRQIELLQDKVDTLHALCEGTFSVQDLLDRIKDLFREVDESNKPNTVLFYSIHKAKGAENANVFLIEPQLVPHPRAVKEESQKQEMNLLYIAITRVWANESDPKSGNLHFVGEMPAVIRDRGKHLLGVYHE